MDTKNVMDKIKELIQKGNVSKIVVRRKGEVLLSIPVNVGVVGAVIGITAAKWAVLAAVLGTVGFGCSVEIVKDDGEVLNVVTEEDTQKAKDTAVNIANDVKEAAMNLVNQVKETPEQAQGGRTPTSSRSWTIPSPKSKTTAGEKSKLFSLSLLRHIDADAALDQAGGVLRAALPGQEGRHLLPDDGKGGLIPERGVLHPAQQLPETGDLLLGDGASQPVVPHIPLRSSGSMCLASSICCSSRGR